MTHLFFTGGIEARLSEVREEQTIAQRCLKSALPVKTDLIESSEMMTFIPLCLASLAWISVIQEQTGAFDDLGKLLLGGVAAAVVVAVAVTLVRFRLRDKKPPASSFISINSQKDAS